MDAHEMARHLGWAYVERCGGGEFGAHLVRRGDERAILKVGGGVPVADTRKSVELARRAAAAGQLVPEYLDVGEADGVVYTVQRFVDGDLPEPLTLTHARQLVAGLDAQAGAARGVPPWALTWLTWDPLAVLAGAGGKVASLGDEIAAVEGRLRDLPLPTDDVVHGDYHMRNLLVRGRRVVTVFDWEGAMPGDRRTDLFTLAWWADAVPAFVTRPAAAFVRREVHAVLAADELAVYAARTALRNLDFYTRVRPSALDDFCIAAVERLLAPYWR